jgi:hypothetical protein
VKNFILAFILLALYLGNSRVLGLIYPNLSDYSQFIEHYYARLKIYEVMFCLFFLLGMWNTERLAKAFCTFGFISCFASCFDKLILNIHQYLLTDILVVLFALIVSIRVYNAR